MVGSSPGEDRPLEGAMKLDERAFEPADDTLAITLQPGPFET